MDIDWTTPHSPRRFVRARPMWRYFETPSVLAGEIALPAGATSIALGAVALWRWDESRSMAVLAAAILYVLGMFVCTIVFNVPLNDALAAVDPASTDGAAVWTRYLNDWTFWNHVRTVASLGAAALFTFALSARA
jgi:uncharacterized membrane protein